MSFYSCVHVRFSTLCDEAPKTMAIYFNAGTALKLKMLLRDSESLVNYFRNKKAINGNHREIDKLILPLARCGLIKRGCPRQWRGNINHFGTLLLLRWTTISLGEICVKQIPVAKFLLVFKFYKMTIKQVRNFRVEVISMP